MIIKWHLINDKASKAIFSIIKRKHTEWRKYLQIIYMIRSSYSEFIMNSYDSTTKQQITQLKNGPKTYTFLQRRHIYMINKHMKRFSTSLHHCSRRKTQIKTTIDSISLNRIAIIQTNKQKITNVGKEMEKLELLGTAGQNVKWCSCYRKQSGDSSKN